MRSLGIRLEQPLGTCGLERGASRSQIPLSDRPLISQASQFVLVTPDHRLLRGRHDPRRTGH